MSKKNNKNIVKDGYEPSSEEGESGDDYEESETERSMPVMEKFRRKKKRKRGKKVQDPLVVCGFDIMLMILNHLDAHSLATSLLVCRKWRTVASNDTIWSKKCEELWANKAHLPRFSQGEALSKLSAYALSSKDGKRNRIMKEDLWDHTWEFHFKKDAPEYWRNLDPFWKGTEPPMRRYFHPDGSQTADFGDEAWGGHECCYSIVTSMLEDGIIRQHYGPVYFFFH